MFAFRNVTLIRGFLPSKSYDEVPIPEINIVETIRASKILSVLYMSTDSEFSLVACLSELQHDGQSMNTDLLMPTKRTIYLVGASSLVDHNMSIGHHFLNSFVVYPNTTEATIYHAYAKTI